LYSPPRTQPMAAFRPQIKTRNLPALFSFKVCGHSMGKDRMIKKGPVESVMIKSNQKAHLSSPLSITWNTLNCSCYFVGKYMLINDCVVDNHRVNLVLVGLYGHKDTEKEIIKNNHFHYKRSLVATGNIFLL